MILASPGEVILTIGSLKIYYYGVIMALAVLIGLFACKLVCKKIYEDSDFDVIYNLSVGTIICGFLGARLYYVFAAYKYFLYNPWEIFAFRNGGMAIHGAIIGGLIFAVLYLKYKKLPVLKYLDILSFGLVSGQIIGRWGNFFKSDAFGMPTFSWLKLYIPVEKRPVEFAAFDYFHPTFLYEILLNIILLLLLCIIARKTKKFGSGFVLFSYILFYSIIRMFVEYIRIDSVLNLSGIPLAQYVSLIGILTGIIGLFILSFKNKIC